MRTVLGRLHPVAVLHLRQHLGIGHAWKKILITNFYADSLGAPASGSRAPLDAASRHWSCLEKDVYLHICMRTAPGHLHLKMAIRLMQVVALLHNSALNMSGNNNFLRIALSPLSTIPYFGL